MSLREFVEKHKYDADFIATGLSIDVGYALQSIAQEQNLDLRMVLVQLGYNNDTIDDIIYGDHDFKLSEIAKILSYFKIRELEFYKIILDKS